MHKIGKVCEMDAISGKVPNEVYSATLRIVTILDNVYGEHRDIDKNDGGFVFIAQNKRDLDYFIKHHFDPRNGSQEDIQVISTEKGQYLSFFFLCNNEYSINLIILASLLPEIAAKMKQDRL